MKCLGIDWGKSKLGLAYSGGSLSYPLKVIKYQVESEVISILLKIIESEHINKIIIGVSEERSEEEAKKFAKNLSKHTNLEILFQDETLTTHDAQKNAIEAGIKRKKRREMEDAYAASIMLQNYLDSL